MNAEMSTSSLLFLISDIFFLILSLELKVKLFSKTKWKMYAITNENIHILKMNRKIITYSIQMGGQAIKV